MGWSINPVPPGDEVQAGDRCCPHDNTNLSTGDDRSLTPQTSGPRSHIAQWRNSAATLMTTVWSMKRLG